VWDDSAGELRRGDQAALDVNVGVDEAGSHEAAFKIDHLPGGVTLPDAHDVSPVDCDVRLIDLSREHVDQASSREEQVSRLVTARQADPMGQLHHICFSLPDFF
jgi:hypothetical protein